METGKRYRDSDGDVWEECVTVQYRMLDARTGRPGVGMPPLSRDELREDFGPLTALDNPEPSAAQPTVQSTPLADVLASLADDMDRAFYDTPSEMSGDDVLPVLAELFKRAAEAVNPRG